MTQYLFIFGRKTLLSLAEIISVFPNVSIKNFEKNRAILEFPEIFGNAQEIQSHLGGTRIIAQEINDPSLENLTRIIKNKHKDSGGKIIFSMTLESLTHEDEHSMKNLLKKIKKNLNEKGQKSRYQEKYLGGEGTHFIAYYENKKLKIGLIEAIQDFRAYAKRDYEKPFRDTKSGMLPPKIAQIMIHLSGIKNTNVKKGILYDPFCGSGTILVEASLMGFDVIGSDIDEKAIEGAKKNLAAIRKSMDISMKNNTSVKIFTKDVTKIQPTDLEQKPDVIVNESYLGPFFSQKPAPEKIAEIQKELEKLYAETLKKLRPFNIPIVIALPAHKKEKYIFLPNIHKIISHAGFKIKPIFEKKFLAHFDHSKDEDTTIEAGYIPDRNTFLYDRPDQNVAREIFVLDIA